MLIAIPSKGRPGLVKSADYITTATVFVPEDEVDVYRRTGGGSHYSIELDF